MQINRRTYCKTIRKVTIRLRILLPIVPVNSPGIIFQNVIIFIRIICLYYVSTSIIIKCYQFIPVSIRNLYKIPTHSMPRFNLLIFTHMPDISCKFYGIEIHTKLISISLCVTNFETFDSFALFIVYCLFVGINRKYRSYKVSIILIIKKYL